MTLFNLPPDVLRIIGTIEASGFEAWCVGGCVRDMLMGREPSDFDLCTSAPPERIISLFEKVIPTGLRHGTVTVMLSDTPYEITRFRIDGNYSDSRHPESVTFTDDITLDLSRRDFTVNAMAYHPERGLCDPFGGRDDIKGGTIRTVGDPEKRFSEDALRLLRAVRFSSTTGFTVEKSTADAVCRLAPTLSLVSAERIRVETVKTLSSPSPEALAPLLENGGFCHLGLKNTRIDFSPIKSTPCNYKLRFAAMCFLLKADSGAIAKGFKFSNVEIAEITSFGEIFEESELDLPFLKRYISVLGYDGVFAAVSAYKVLNSRALSRLEAKLSEAMKNNHPHCLSMLALSGGALVELGLSGEEIGQAQRILLEKVLENPELNTPDKLKSIIQR